MGQWIPAAGSTAPLGTVTTVLPPLVFTGSLVHGTTGTARPARQIVPLNQATGTPVWGSATYENPATGATITPAAAETFRDDASSPNADDGEAVVTQWNDGTVEFDRIDWMLADQTISFTQWRNRTTGAYVATEPDDLVPGTIDVTVLAIELIDLGVDPNVEFTRWLNADTGEPIIDRTYDGTEYTATGPLTRYRNSAAAGPFVFIGYFTDGAGGLVTRRARQLVQPDADGVPDWATVTYEDPDDGTALTKAADEVFVDGWPPANVSTSIDVYRLAWDEIAAATATTSDAAGVVTAGAVGDHVTIVGAVGDGLTSITWAWQPATAPVIDPGDATQVLVPTVTVNGLAYIVHTEAPLFRQLSSTAISANGGEELVGSWTFQVDNGAHIEITTTRKV